MMSLNVNFEISLVCGVAHTKDVADLWNGQRHGKTIYFLLQVLVTFSSFKKLQNIVLLLN